MDCISVRFFLPASSPFRGRCAAAVASSTGIRIVEDAAAEVAVFDAGESCVDARIRDARRNAPLIHSLLLSPRSSQMECVAAILRRAHGLLPYHQIESRLPAAVRHLAGGLIWFPVDALPAVTLLHWSDARAAHGLTEQEWRVTALASRGLTTGQIADLLDVSVWTIKFHLDNAYRKLGVHSRREICSL